VRRLADDGITIFLTTQYLEEADRLADRIAVIDGGRLIAEGTADELKQGVAGERVELTFTDVDSFTSGSSIVTGVGVERDAERLAISVATTDTVATVKRLLDVVTAHQLPIDAVDNITIVRPSLDDVFLTLTGHPSTEEHAA
jgi:ABC-2 type transport system ATP-binding protein